MISRMVMLGSLLICGSAFSQMSLIPQEGILPFSGARFFNRGLGGENIKVLLNEDTWTSNRLPIDTDFEIKLVEPTGLKIAEDGYYHPGVEVLISNTKHDTLGHIPNIFGEESEGFDPEMLKSLTVSLGFNEMSKTGDTCLLLIRFFDTQSDNFLLIDLPVIIADPALPLDVTTSTYAVSSSRGYLGIATGVEMPEADVQLNKLDFDITLPELGELTEKQFKAGKLIVWLYDAKLEVQKQNGNNVSSALTTDEKTNLKVKIAVAANTKYVRFRWESADGEKVIDFVSRV